MNFSFDHLRGKVRSERRDRPEPDAPFRILVIGDFSGRANRDQLDPLPGRTARKADIDTLETLLTEWKTRLGLRAGTEHAFAMGFSELEHFHPDEVFARVELFGALRDLRARLTNPKTSPQAAAEVRAWAGGKPGTNIEPKPMNAPSTPRSEFEALLGGSTGKAPPAATSAVDAIIRDLIRPHILPATEPDLGQLVALVDDAISTAMRSVLHEPHFQQLEANWLGLHQLITGLELGEELDLHALDASRAEIASDISTNSARGLTEILAERPAAGANPWSVVCMLERFGAEDADAQLVGALAMCATAGGTILLAGADDTLAGTDSIASSPRPENWTTPPGPEAEAKWRVVRSLPEAAAVGLALPRVLARLPYSPAGDPVATFEFIECPHGSSHEDYLWGNPAVACTLLLGRAFTDRGWSLGPQSGGDIDGLPVHVEAAGPDRTAMPCAEAWLTDSAANRLLEKGLIPVLSVQNRDAVRVPRLTAINGKPLAASWT